MRPWPVSLLPGEKEESPALASKAVRPIATEMGSPVALEGIWHVC
jgi:hypothetical protein